MQLDTEKLQPYIELFIEFYETEAYWEGERSYKERLHKTMKEVVTEDTILAPGLPDRLLKELFFKTSDAFINLIGNANAYLNFQGAVENSSDEEIQPILLDLIYGKSVLEERFGSAKVSFNDLAKAKGRASINTSIITIFLSYMLPDKHLVWKPRYFKKILTFFTSGIDMGNFPGGYVQFLPVAEEILSLLKDYKPRRCPGSTMPDPDMMDVTTFIYVYNSYTSGDDYGKKIFGGLNNSNNGIKEWDISELLEIIRTKRQVILYGPPGTSKTWLAEKIVASFADNQKGDTPPEYDGELEITPKVIRTLIGAYKSEEDDLYENLPKDENRLAFITNMRKHISEFIEDSKKRGVRKYEESPLQYLAKELKSETGLSIKPWLKISQFPIWENYYGKYGKNKVNGYLRSVIDLLESLSHMDNLVECDIRLEEFIEEGVPKTGLMLGALLYPLQPDIYPILGVGPHIGSQKIGVDLPFMNLDEYILASTLCRDFLVKYRTDLNATDLLDVTAFFDWLSYSEIEDYYSDTEESISEPLVKYYNIVQFHPSYTYEDFVRGLVAQPTVGGVTFKPQDKIFARMCGRANADYERAMNSNTNPNAFILIIDEINRADISKVFGELIYGLEYRGKPIETPYEIDGSTTITIPPNLYIIGTMNTADKSIAMLDYALRRRFAFIPMYPDAEIIKSYYSDDYPETKKAALNLFRMVSDCFDDTSRDLAVGHTYCMVGEKGKGGIIYTPGEAGKLEPVEDDEQGLELLRLKFIYETAPIIHEYILAGEEGVNAGDIKKAYEKGNIEDNLADIFEAWISGKDIEDDEGAEEGETPIEDDGDIGEDSE